jgi:hypothetical protein
MRAILPALAVVLWAIEQASGAAPAAAQADLNFRQVVLDQSYIAYERDVGDIDGGGYNDVVAVMEGDTTVQVFHAPAWKRSTLITFTGEHRYPRADDFKIVDMDGDGDLDVVTRLGKGPSDDGAGIAVWCENRGSPANPRGGQGSNFVQHLIGNSLEYVKDIVVADFDRDRRPDVAMRMDRRTQLWLQEPGGTWAGVLLTHPAHEGMEAGDLDMDGDPDLILNGYWFETPDTAPAARVAANYAYHVIDSVWFNQTGDWTVNSCKVVVGDFDADGRNDVAFSHSERAGHAVAWYGSATPRVDGAWNKHAVAVVDFCHTLQAADFDLDGDVDLLAGGMIQSQHRGLRLMLNGGGGADWTQFVIQTDGSYSAEIGDIDNDGDADIVGIRNWNAAPTWIYRNTLRDARTRGVAHVEETRPKHFPHRIWAACDFEGRTPDYAWFGPPETSNIPRYPGNTTALGAGDRPYQDFSALMTGINPVPGPRMGKVNQLYLRYFLRGGTEATFQHFRGPPKRKKSAFGDPSLTSEDNNHIRVWGLTEGKWSELTLNFTRDGQRNDATPGIPFKDGERMDDLKIFVGKPGDGKRYDLAIDDVIFFATDPDLPPEPEPFPNRVIFLGAFDTGTTATEKPKYWPGEFEIASDGLPSGSHWNVARAVPQPDTKGKWIRLQIVPPRPVGARTKLRFRYHLTGASQMTVQLFDLTDNDNRHIRLRGLKPDAWQTVYLDFTRDARRNDGRDTPFAAGHLVDDLFFCVEGVPPSSCGAGKMPATRGREVNLLIDEVVLFDAGKL